MTSCRFKQGFTLIEMLVVIAIIAILASMLAPGLRKALDMANLTQCSNKLKQVGIAIFNYSNDYRGFIPSSNSNARVAEIPFMAAYWHSALAYNGYVDQPDTCQSGTSLTIGKDIPSSNSIWGCPSEDNLRPGPDGMTTGSWTGTHFGINIYIAGLVKMSDDIKGIRLNSINSPSQTFLAGPSGKTATVGYRLAVSGFNCSIKPRHNEKAPVLLSDGHIQTFDEMETILSTMSPDKEKWWYGESP